MLPEFFYDIRSNIDKYFDDQYPAVDDCIAIDKQILALQKDINDLNARALAKKVEYSTTAFALAKATDAANKCPKFTTICIGANNVNNLYAQSVLARKKGLDYLTAKLKQKENIYALSDCRNKTEIKRTEETAGLFSETSAKNETTLLAGTKTKQYLLIGVGSAVLLTTLLILLKRKK